MAILLAAVLGVWRASDMGEYRPSTTYNGGGAVHDYSQSGFVLGGGDFQAMPAAAPLGSNPFEGTSYYVNEDYQERVRESMRSRWADGHTQTEMSSMLSVPSAFWVDRIAKIRKATTANGGASLESILSDAAAKSLSSKPPPLVVVILYDLPNRDCHAYASNGEVCCEYAADGTSCNYETLDGTCRVGLTKYKGEYVDAFVGMLEQYRQVRPPSS